MLSSTNHTTGSASEKRGGRSELTPGGGEDRCHAISARNYNPRVDWLVGQAGIMLDRSIAEPPILIANCFRPTVPHRAACRRGRSTTWRGSSGTMHRATIANRAGSLAFLLIAMPATSISLLASLTVALSSSSSSSSSSSLSSFLEPLDFDRLPR